MVRGRLRRLFSFLWPYRVRLFWFLAVGVLYSAVSASFPKLVELATNLLANRAIPPVLLPYTGDLKLRKVFFLLLLLALLLTGLKCLLQYFRRYLQSWITQRVVVDAQNRLADHLLLLDLSFFEQERSGELLSRLTNDLNLLGVTVKVFGILATHPITLLMMLGVIFQMNWRLAVLGLLGAPAAGYAVNFLSQKMRRAAQRVQQKRADLTNVMVQFLAGMWTVKAFGCEQFESQQFRKENRAYFDVCMKRERARSRVRPVVEFTASLGTLIALAVGGEWIFNGKLQYEEMMAFLVALGLMYQPAKELSDANTELQEALPGAERVFEVLDLRPNVIEGTHILPPFSHAIDFEDVSFSYVPGQPVLRHITLTLRKGERVALVGRSGAGKTTLTDLLLRFYDVEEGRILIDGIDIRQVTFRSLRDQIAVVNQSPFLFNCSLRENIAYGRSDATMEQIVTAAQAANIHEEILAMPQGYETPAGERGEALSGGQRQRVAIARAIFKNAPILILDEATSALDSENERKVQEALDRLMEGRTAIVIAHRLSTVRNADRIFVMEAGEIIAQGRHEELLVTCPLYESFVRLQTLQ